jgi:hypothetical protein
VFHPKQFQPNGSVQVIEQRVVAANKHPEYMTLSELKQAIIEMIGYVPETTGYVPDLRELAGLARSAIDEQTEQRGKA